MDELVVSAATPADMPLARRLAAELGAALSIDGGQGPRHYELLCEQGRLVLRDRRPGAPGALCVDFFSDRMLWRRHSGRELLVKAAGIKAGYRPHVFDATAGLGRDAAVLAAAGCRVTMAERNPLLAAMLRAAIDSARQSPEWAQEAERFALLRGDARALLAQAATDYDVIMLDPMFPPRGKSAKVKKEMQYLQALVGADDSGEELLALALQCAARRVVVKRPLHAPPLAGRPPHHAHEGKAMRFDVYLGMP